MSVCGTTGSRSDKDPASQIRIGNDPENMVHDSTGASGTSSQSYPEDVLGRTGNSKCGGTTWRFLWDCPWKAEKHGNTICGNAGCQRI